MSEFPLQEEINIDLKSVKEKIYQICSTETVIRDALQLLIFEGEAKFLRPTLFILISKYFDSIKLKRKCDVDNLYDIAAAFELLHTATLLHDDVIDNSNIRRGLPSIHRVYGNSFSILLADHCFAQATQLALRSNNLQIIREFINAAIQMSKVELISQVGDRAYDDDIEFLKEKYYMTIDSRTAALFSAICKTSSLMFECREIYINDFNEIGLLVGRSFQIIDDILDFRGDEKKLGKPLYNDLRNGVLTLPVILTLQKLDDPFELLNILNNDDLTRSDVHRCIKIINDYDGIAESYKEASYWVEEAIRILHKYPDNKYRDAIEGLSHYILDRYH